MKTFHVPSAFCWTKFGPEAGETVDSILQRKDREREANNGTFLWGIGNSVAPGIQALVRRETSPRVVFSPMRAKPKAIDIAPTQVVQWNGARRIDGAEWPIPRGSRVTSRGWSGKGAVKRVHYALVCQSDTPLSAANGAAVQLHSASLSNLVSGSPVGYSQVTSIVGYGGSASKEGTRYSVGFWAQLIFPYFVELFDPSPLAKGSFDVHRDQHVGSDPWPQQLALETT